MNDIVGRINFQEVTMPSYPILLHDKLPDFAKNDIQQFAAFIRVELFKEFVADDDRRYIDDAIALAIELTNGLRESK